MKALHRVIKTTHNIIITFLLFCIMTIEHLESGCLIFIVASARAELSRRSREDLPRSYLRLIFLSISSNYPSILLPFFTILHTFTLPLPIQPLQRCHISPSPPQTGKGGRDAEKNQTPKSVTRVWLCAHSTETSTAINVHSPTDNLTRVKKMSTFQ